MNIEIILFLVKPPKFVGTSQNTGYVCLQDCMLNDINAKTIRFRSKKLCTYNKLNMPMYSFF